jgi:hypothetical protein
LVRRDNACTDGSCYCITDGSCYCPHHVLMVQEYSSKAFLSLNFYCIHLLLPTNPSSNSKSTRQWLVHCIPMMICIQIVGSGFFIFEHLFRYILSC